MQIAIPFQANGKYNDVVDEFIINYSENENRYDKLIDFITVFPNKIININYNGEIDFSKLDLLNKIGQIKIILDISKISYIEKLKEHNIKFYFKDLIATNYYQLHSFLSLGISDIYITDDLCYDLKNVRKYCKDKKVKMRVILNRIPHTFKNAKNKEIMFYRPEDEFWRYYFDVGEFDVDFNGKKNWDVLNVLYETYFIKQRWFGNLQEIIRDLPFPVYNKSLIPDYNDYRINCRMLCKTRHSICNKCEQFLDIANILTKKNIRFNYEK